MECSGGNLGGPGIALARRKLTRRRAKARARDRQARQGPCKCLQGSGAVCKRSSLGGWGQWDEAASLTCADAAGMRSSTVPGVPRHTRLLILHYRNGQERKSKTWGHYSGLCPCSSSSAVRHCKVLSPGARRARVGPARRDSGKPTPTGTGRPASRDRDAGRPRRRRAHDISEHAR